MDRSIVGKRIFDINKDGLAHIGMLPDFIADLQALGLTQKDLAPFLHSALGYIKVWERANSHVGRVRVRNSNGKRYIPESEWTSAPFRGVQGTFFADVTGDGRADAIGVQENTIVVRRSGLRKPGVRGFLRGADWSSGPFHGQRGTFFADVTGDGRTDAIAVDDHTVTVRRSDGARFGSPEDWTSYPYYGQRGTFFADVTGDGKADAIVVNDAAVTVRRSDGTRFTPNETWTAGPYYGQRGTFFADVTGDGKADAIVINDDAITVRRSDGSHFLANEDWTGGAYYGQRGTFFTDVTGDGIADAIAVNDDTTIVRHSDGARFMTPEDWTEEPYFGTHGTYFADVTGDGRSDAIIIHTRD